MRAVFEGRYEILGELGTGGFGTVYKARQLATGQPVAIKVMRNCDDHDAASLARRLARFEREMKLCGQMHHPNIVRLLDSGKTEDALVYSVFEFAPGDDLSNVLAREGRLDPVETKHLMLQVLDALACAHAEGVVHRDLKPANIMVIPTGARRNALVLDFGIGAFTEATPGEHQARITGSNESVGTPAYAAPEQLRGQPPTPRSDLYSWGLIFLECLTGKRVIIGDWLGDVIFKQMDPGPIAMPPGLAGHALARILRRVVVKDARDRDVTAQGLLRELEACDVASLRERLEVGEPVAVHAGSNALTETLQLAPVARPRPESPPAAVALPTPQGHEGERRQLTAVCCGLITTACSTATDIEDIDELIVVLQERGVEIARRYDGRVAGALGDHVLFYFGYPVAREDDARRAARTAIELVRELGEETAKLAAERTIRVELRVGVHTGLVIARERRETGPAALGPALGATANIATRLCAAAAPGTIMVSADTARLVRNQFSLDDDRPVALDGGRTIEVFRLGDQRRAASSSGSRQLSDETPMVGRAAELDALVQRWARVKAGEGQAVLITGEPGIGKSRLAQELARTIRDEPHSWLDCRCSPDSVNSALQPIIDLLNRLLDRADAVRDTTPADRADRLAALLTSYGFELSEAMPLFAPLLSIPLGERFPALSVSPHKHRELTRGAVLALLSEMADREPMVLAVEDLHWADPSTLELLNLLVSEIGTARICALFTARPELGPSWSAASMLHLPLGRLGRSDIEEMAKKITQGRALPGALVEHVASRTDGVPLFVEELVRMMLESGALRLAGDRYELVGALAELGVPATLRDSLMARLDRLGAAKETAQIAAALGREFSWDVLSAVSVSGDATVREDLDKLVAAGLVFHKRRLKQSVYTFKHALVRDTAYESMPRRARQQVHARIAKALEDRFPAVVADRPDLLALHHAAADQKRAALGYAQQAAMAALMRSANAEAIAHARQALGWLDALDGAQARIEAELGLNGIIIPALMATQGFGSPALKQAAVRSNELIGAVADSAHVGPTIWALLTYYTVMNQHDQAAALAARFVTLADNAADTGQQVASLIALGMNLLSMGRLVEARGHVERALALYDPIAHRDHALRYGMDSKANGDSLLCTLLWFLGYPDQSRAHGLAALAWARELAHAVTLGGICFGVSCVYQYRGARAEVIELSDELRELAKRYEIPLAVAYSELLRSWAERDLGAARQAIATLEAFGYQSSMSYWSSLVAEVEALAGDHDAALARIARCIARIDETGAQFYAAELHRLHGELVLARDPDASAQAEVCFETAITAAQALALKMSELRATLALHQLHRAHGQAERSRARLAAIHGWFAEGADVAAIREAGALLADSSTSDRDHALAMDQVSQRTEGTK